MTFSRKKADKAESSVFSFVERAGSNSSAQSVVGSGVPGVLHGLNLAHQRFGKLSWKQLLSPVVKLARYFFLNRDAIFYYLSYLYFRAWLRLN